MDTTQTVWRSARLSLLGTLFSRFSGLFRDLAMAFTFGASAEMGAFFVAYRLANLFRRLLGEGNLQGGFIPHFESLKKESIDKGVLFYRETARSLGVVSVFTVMGLEIFLYGLRPFLPADWQAIVSLAMWMTPGLLFISLSGLNCALLQSQKKYFWPSAAPIAFNAAWIGAAFIANAPAGLALGITIAYGMQWAVTSAQAQKELPIPTSDPIRLFSPEVKKLIRPMGLGIIGAGAMQLNGALDAIFARLADPSGPAYLWYAIRLEQLPLALFGIALSGALLPPLARAVQEGAHERFQSLLQSAMRSACALMIPCTFGLLALGGAGINLLYGHGDFTLADGHKTQGCLQGYSLCLLPSVFVLLIVQGFNAKKSYGVTVRATLYSVLANVFLNALFVFGFKGGAASIAWATGISSWVNCLILRPKIPIAYCLRLTIGSVVAALAVGVTEGFVGGPTAIGGQIAQFALLAFVYVGIFIAMALVLQIDEYKNFLSGVAKSRSRCG